jgi:hypothetical protein
MSDKWMKIDGIRGDGGNFDARRKGWIPVSWDDFPSARVNGVLRLRARIQSEFKAIFNLVVTGQRVAEVALEIDRPRGAGRIDLFGVRLQNLTLTPPDPLPQADLELRYERLEFIHVWVVSP